MKYNLTHKFELNEQWYITDEDTIKLLRQIVPAAQESGDSSAVMAVMGLGKHMGRIVEVADGS